MNLHNELYHRYEAKQIGNVEILNAHSQGLITTESANVILSLTPDYSLEEAIRFKKEELSYLCGKAIDGGIDVKLSDGEYHHFSLTKNDQNNLNAKMLNVLAGVEEHEYHEDGQPFKMYSSDEMLIIYSSYRAKVDSETAYYNCAKIWLDNCKTVEEVRKVNYGDSIPEEYWTEPWRNIVNKVEIWANKIEDEENGEEPKGLLARVANLIKGKK